MLSNTFIVSEFVEIFYSFPTWSYVKMCHGTTTSASHLAMCHMVPRPVYFTWQCGMRYHDQCNLAICHTVPLRVYFNRQCAMWYHDQCNLAMCHAVPQPVYFTRQCVIRYQNQCLSPAKIFLKVVI